MTRFALAALVKLASLMHATLRQAQGEREPVQVDQASCASVRSATRLGWAALLAGCLLAAPAAWAHKPSDSYLTLQAQAGSGEVTARWDIALRDLDYVLQLDRDNNGELTWAEVRQREADITRLATEHLQLSSGEYRCPWRTTGSLQLEHHSDGTYAVLSLAAGCLNLDAGLKAHYSLFFDVDPSHRGLVQWIAPGAQADGKAAQALIFGTESAEQNLALQPAGAWQTLRQYLVDGVWHIWIGYDHILFLLALLLPSVLLRRAGQWQQRERFFDAFKEVVKVVTAFTLAHSITLSLAALQVISLPSRLVESAIAASVVIAALNNLRGTRWRPWARAGGGPLAAGSGSGPGTGTGAGYRSAAHGSGQGPGPAPSDAASAPAKSRLWVLAFCFGLLHGFGFASVLADLGLPQGALVLALVGFNLGVEVGQLAIVAVFLPVAFALRRTRFYQFGVLKVGSLIVAALASWWLVQRMFNL